ncbi:aminodeoxychorismate synthase component I [Aquibacillus sediminis]|uniref:aminodeoxychorismate synthase component I n=1 Tax=Aquibacillus sediminis TaxID=2574734 RepID=UPI0011098E4E|nr:aminodeoxychorismate synthase component I [Aquibacillus sediminis]
MNPYLLFEFENNDKQPFQFTNPIEILQATEITEIGYVFQQVEKALSQGYYVAGYVSYEAAPAFNANYKVHNNPNLPLVWFGVFSQPTFVETIPVNSTQDYHVSDWSLTSTFEHYYTGIQTIKQAIEDGNTYQVNYTTRLEAQFSGNDQAFYQQLTRNQEASYSAYLNIGNYRILSASPELFFKVKNQKITTKPMKGTAKRGRFISEDEALKEHLSQSEKEQAENLMIVDLLRNDIGKIAKPGSVHVTKLFEIESYPTVHQMTSTVEAELEDNKTVFEWFQALFPCGSITGAPKIRTMDYIAELEQTPRDVYCGAIGFISPEREAIFNVPIRTVVLDSETGIATYGVGGGVTWDSTLEGEYDELHTKARLLTTNRPSFQLLESLKLDNGNYPLLHYHIDRLTKSANHFNFKLEPQCVEESLLGLASRYSQGEFKVRLLVDKDGNLLLEETPLASIATPVTCNVAKDPVHIHDPFLYHKTTNRAIYQQHQSNQHKDAFSVLLWNEDEELTEFTIGNLVVEKNGKYFTPPIQSGLLAGTFRQYLLDTNQIEEKVIHKDELSLFDNVWFINSVRGWLPVEID